MYTQSVIFDVYYTNDNDFIFSKLINLTTKSYNNYNLIFHVHAKKKKTQFFFIIKHVSFTLQQGKPKETCLPVIMISDTEDEKEGKMTSKKSHTVYFITSKFNKQYE